MRNPEQIQPTTAQPETPRKETNPAFEAEKGKIERDPTRAFLHEQGFAGDPKVEYSVDVISAKNSKGESLLAKRSFTNYEDLQAFIRDNSDLLAGKDTMDETGVAPYRIDYDRSVSEWSSKLSPEQAKKFEAASDAFLARTMARENFQNVGNREAGVVLAYLSQPRPEITQNIGDSGEVEKVVREMGGVESAGQDLQRLARHLQERQFEDADKVLAGYVYRSLYQRMGNIFQRTDLPIPWEEKERMLALAQLAGKIRDRQGGTRTRDLLAQKKNLDSILKNYEGGQPEQATGTARPQERGPKQKHPFERALSSPEIAAALNMPSNEYSPRKGVAMMTEVFKKLYPDPQRRAERLEAILTSFRSVVEKITKEKPGKSEDAYRAFAEKKVLKSLSESERNAIEDFLERDFQKARGGEKFKADPQKTISDLIGFLEKVKR